MNSTPAELMTEPSSGSLERYLRAAHYLAAAQIYLQDNVLLREPLRVEHVKDRLLGHWGTCPGINLVYAHLNRLILRNDFNVMLITGPGHGAPANLANLYLEGSLREFYPELTHDAAGVRKFVREFSWPGGFPSHLYPGVPGTIHEGGELGYALATAFGAAFDNPDLLVACIVGDGEAETGPTAAAWHGTKFLDSAESGAVLPILHVNGYKISNPTISGSMSDDELRALFTGYGWQPRFVQGEDLSTKMAVGMDWALEQIREIQRSARSGKPVAQPRWPMLLLRSRKGWTGVQELEGKPVEGSFRAHQVPVSDVKKNPDHLRLVEDWLRSYRPEELFDENGEPCADILACCPQGERRMGCNPLRLRVVNVTDLFILETESDHPHGLDAVLFDALFTSKAPVIVNFHGYPSAVKQLLYGRNVSARFLINGYREEGNTTTPFDMLVRNGASRYHLVIQAIRATAPHNPRVAIRASERVLFYEYLLRDFSREIRETGRDPEAIRAWQWNR
ncbi:MAG: hypothetical protein JO334_08385 [Verrucomicrobia bacterium]|nr:hypothetical protein [Verrucomicrobiota bacterium]